MKVASHVVSKSAQTQRVTNEVNIVSKPVNQVSGPLHATPPEAMQRVFIVNVSSNVNNVAPEQKQQDHFARMNLDKLVLMVMSQ